MKPCSRVGVNLTKKCNWSCKHCFYRYAPDFNTPYDKPLVEVTKELDKAKARGCNHAVAVGWGEPGLYKELVPWIQYATSIGMTSSIITNGTLPVSLYDGMYKAGLDHLHMSCHAVGPLLDHIAEKAESDKRQMATKEWLAQNNLPWRANITLQSHNYKELPAIAENLIANKCYHIVLLGFLPHYEWGNRVTEIAVHPAELRPYIEKTLDIILSAGVYTTLRYHPFCHLDAKYWKYVVNARYVLFDPWEWDYDAHNSNIEKVWQAAVAMGNSVSIQTPPCSECDLQMHCGGWNRVYAGAFKGANLTAVKGLSAAEKVRGYYHDQNPVNLLKGWIK